MDVPRLILLGPLGPLGLCPLRLPLQVGWGSDQQSGTRWPGGSLEPPAEGRRCRGEQSHQSRRPHHCAEWRRTEGRWSPWKVEDFWLALLFCFFWVRLGEQGRVYISIYYYILIHSWPLLMIQKFMEFRVGLGRLVCCRFLCAWKIPADGISIQVCIFLYL